MSFNFCACHAVLRQRVRQAVKTHILDRGFIPSSELVFITALHHLIRHQCV